MKILIILPNHLFDYNIIISPKYKFDKIICIEEPMYFCHNNDLQNNYFPVKMIYQVACLMNYYDTLPIKINKQYIKILDCDKFIKNLSTQSQLSQTIFMIDPLYYSCKTKYETIFKKNNFIILDYPNFLLPKEIHLQYFQDYKKTRFTSFYTFIKKLLKFNYKNLDIENRKSKIPEDKLQLIQYNIKKNKYVEYATKYIQKIFKTNCNNIIIIFPTNNKDALIVCTNYINNKNLINNFADYQDVIKSPKSINSNQDNLISLLLFHSALSPCINNGLLSIQYIYDLVLYKYSSNKRFIDAFIRQYFWREFQYYCFINKPIYNSLVLNKSKSLYSIKSWYDEKNKNNFKIVNDAIYLAKKYGYLHHIWRLMVTGITMLMQGVSLHDIYKWHLEFACDSHEWVMIQNVYGMIGGLGNTTHKLYIHSSNYIRKMSNGEYFKDKNSNESKKYDKLYYSFKDNNSFL